MKARVIFLILLIIHTTVFEAQTSSQLVHYSEEDGLPQNRIFSIFQDSRGFIWLATQNGATKFDGYSFTSYLNTSSDSYQIRDSRIYRITEDNAQNIWFITNEGNVYCLDPATDSLIDITSQLAELVPSFQVSGIKVVSSKIWLISEENGCVRVQENSSVYDYYAIENNRLSSNRISSVYEDWNKNNWILTECGLALIRSNETEPQLFFGKNDLIPQAFYSLLELQDSVLFGSDQGRIWRYSKTDQKFTLIELDTSSPVRSLTHGKKGQIVIGTENDGLFVYDYMTGQSEHIHSGNSSLVNNQILSLSPDPYENIWIQLPVSGATRFDLNEKSFTHYVSSIDKTTYSEVSLITRTDSAERFWIRPRNEDFSYYDPAKKAVIPFNKTKFSPSPNYSSSIYSVYFDRQNNLWLSTSEKGLDKITFSNDNFQIQPFNPEKNSDKNSVRAILEDAKGNTWFATKDGKIHISDPVGKSLGYLCSDGTIGAGTPIYGMTYCLHQDASENIWIGTRGEGIYRLTPVENRYKIEHFAHDPDNPYSLNSNHVFSIRGDSKGRIWIGTWGKGLNLFSKKEDGTACFIHHNNQLKSYPIEQASGIRYISEEKNGKIYIATNSGLVVFDSGYESVDQISFRHYKQRETPEGSITKGDIHHILHTSSGTYLSTAGGGINYVEAWGQDGFPMSFGAYTRKDGLASDNILSVLEDANSYLWVFSEENLTRFDPQTKSFKTFNSVNRLIHPGLFQEGATILTHSQRVLQGSSSGVFSFKPLEMSSSTYIPQIIFTRLGISNEDLSVGDTPYYTKDINQLDKLTLTHRDKTFSIEFAALDFNGPENIRYAYMLEGFNKKWIYSEKQRTASYMNLPKGVYQLRVKSTNADGTWVENERQLTIEILPSFWQTGWAYFLYVLILILLIFVVAYILQTIYRLKNQVRMEAQLAEMKLRYFTDISHEIRTPLTLITAPIDHLISDESISESIKKQLDYVAENTQRMLRMVNQILDFRQAEHGCLKIEQFAIGEYLKTVCLNFEGIAKEKQIDFTYIDTSNGALIWADKDGIEKILFNLLSNAFKYTPSGKSISVELTHNKNGFILKVTDEGKGIDPKKQPFIFNRFFTIKSKENTAGTGIGLFMVKELIEKHSANIQLESVLGVGSSFIVSFKNGFAHYGDDVNWILSPQPNLPEQLEVTDWESIEQQESDFEKPTLLIIEDDPNLRTFILSILTSDYNVFSAEDGKEGYDLAVKHIPDLIISDVMMAKMNGIELLKGLRSNLNTSHIPVILLTAKGAIEDKIEGLENGADDYIVKPFSVSYFQARIENLLQQRKHLQDLYCSTTLLQGKYNQLKVKNIAALDQEFLNQVIEQIESHLDNSNYSIEMLVKSMEISRTAFFKKVKSLTGMAPVDFVRDIRLQNAAKLLGTKQLMVKEVAYMVGFTDLKYFTRCFKVKYNMTPVQYRNSN